MINLYDQLKEYCGCVDVTEDDVAEMINVISMATCWAQSSCETFLMSDRAEVIDLPLCADCVFKFEPFYRPFDPESFKFTFVEIDGINETYTELTDWSYSNIDGVFRIDLGLDCACIDRCGCDPEYKLLVEYRAGYEELPDCILPVFCNLLEVIRSKNNCDCTDCGCESDTPESITYATGDIVTVALETDLGALLVNNYKAQLSSISLCKEKKKIWGFVV